jgi:hypothetical protein
VKIKGDHEPVRFRGTPSKVEGFLPFSDNFSFENAELEARIDAGAPITLRRPEVQSVRATEAITRIIMRLPETTSPGRFYGTLKIGVQTLSIEVLLDARPRLSLMPNRLFLSVGPGHKETVELMVTNRGNMAFEIPREGVVNLLDSAALSLAVHTAFSREEGGHERVNRFVDAVADKTSAAHVNVRDGGGAIEPGELRRLTVQLHLPKSLEAGHSYRGAWELPNARFVVQVYVPMAPPQEVKAS